MNRFIVAMLTIVVAFFALAFSLFIAVPLAILAAISGKKLNRNTFHQPKNAQESQDDNTHTVIEGEYEEIHRK
ncbi:hypothetical protein ACFODT_08835 [Vibrio zhugei]|uniref:Hydroxylamine reductase n=1 Tax=Vibrio zhugei TaxID=2479546 RepID=A0ABV7CC14_9VIBR|nr:hypothetical protein [Vibrio zhugei]